MNKVRFLSFAFAASAVLTGATAQAAVQFDFNTVISGSPVGGPTYATLLIQNAGANTVNFTMTNTSDPNVSGGQFISKLLLNVSPFVAGTLSWTSPTLSSYSFNMDGENDSGAKFDHEVRFVTANNGNRFTAGKVVTWTATGAGLSEDDFQALSSGNTQYEAMIHVQSIPTDGSSAKIVPGEPVPEPASIFAVGLGLAALVRKRRK